MSAFTTVDSGDFTCHTCPRHLVHVAAHGAGVVALAVEDDRGGIDRLGDYLEGVGATTARLLAQALSVSPDDDVILLV